MPNSVIMVKYPYRSDLEWTLVRINRPTLDKGDYIVAVCNAATNIGLDQIM